MEEKKKKFSTAKILYIVLFVLLIAYAMFILGMLLWGLLTSLKSPYDYDTLHNVIGFPNLDKGQYKNSRDAFFKLANFKTVIKNFRMRVIINYYRGSKQVKHVTQPWFNSPLIVDEADYEYVYFLDMLFYTLLYVGGNALITTIVPAVTAYLCAKYDYKLSSVIFVAYTLMMCMPIVGSLPTELTFLKNSGLYDTIWGNYIQSMTGSGMYFFVFFAFFKGMPETYREAASIDGAGHFTIMARIYFPLAIKMLSTVFLIQFVARWNDYQTPLLYLPTHPTLAYVVYNMAHDTNNNAFYNNPTKIASNMLLALPILVLFIGFKNKLMGDISLGGIKE